jgi:hypothetical protein
MEAEMKLTDEDTGKALDVPEAPKPGTELIEAPVGLWDALSGIILALPAGAINAPVAAVAKIANDIAAAKKR